MDVLDNPIWHALTEAQASVAVVAGRACRLPADVAPFAALPDDATAEDWDDLRGLFGPDETLVVFRPSVDPPPGWVVDFVLPTVQMVGDAVEPAPCPGAVELGPGDVEDMLELTHVTKPGPFRRRTRELGLYLGVRDGGRLGTADDVAEAVVAVHGMGWLTGEVVVCDGGLSLRSPINPLG